MKYLFLIIFSIFSTACAQNVSVKEIRLKPSPKSYLPKGTTLIYPIVVTKNTLIDKLINAKIKEEILNPEDGKISIRKALNNLIDEGLIYLTYEVTFKKNDILSIQINAEGCGAHCSSWDTYFNFDLKTGENLTIDDLINANMIDSLRKIVFNDKINALFEYKKEEKSNAEKYGIDSVTYTWAIEHVDSNCMKIVQIQNYSLSNLNIEIIDPCEFPFAIRSHQPIYDLIYPYKFIYPFLKPEFQRRLLK